MKAYKFRPINQAEFIFDIIYKNRLFCANWNDLNDPMEGIFGDLWHFEKKFPELKWFETSAKIKDIRLKLKEYRICSLCKTFDNYLLWSHYANGHKGVVIEVELPDDDTLVHEVNYRAYQFPLLKDIQDADKAAKTILFSKYKVWEYEKEIRILHNKQWFEPVEITKVIIGETMPDAMVNALQAVCAKQNILLYQTRFEGDNLTANNTELRQLEGDFG